MPTAFGTIAGLRQLTQINPRIPFSSISAMNRAVPIAAIIDGTKSRDPDNTGTINVLRAGLLMGKVTTTGKYANSVIGVTTAALGGNQTTLKATAQAVTELVRRVGSSGTFTLSGAEATGQVARSRTVTYSAASGTSITITALGAIAGVNQVNSIVTVDSTGSGTFIITVEGVSTAAITYSATIATLVSNINSALNTTFGTSAIVASGASLAALVLTFSGTGFAARPVGLVTVTLQTGATGFTMNGSGTVGTPSTSPATTAGVTATTGDSGEFVSGSVIGDTDGSQTPICVLAGPGTEYGIDVTDLSSASLNQTLPQFYVSGDYLSAMIVNLTSPTDPTAEAWLKSQLRTYGGVFTFDDDR